VLNDAQSKAANAKGLAPGDICGKCHEGAKRDEGVAGKKKEKVKAFYDAFKKKK
jgi:hypothetical protein